MRRFPRLPVTLLVFLLIEFMDELIYSSREAAWPLIRNDLTLSYIQIGLLLSMEGMIGNVIEMGLGILGDTSARRWIIRIGGILVGLSCVAIAFSSSFWILMLALVIASPASGAFVSLSQAALMDADPVRHEHNMARWTFAGSIGVVVGPLLLTGAAWLGFGWRGLFVSFGGLTIFVLGLAWKIPALDKVIPANHSSRNIIAQIREILRIDRMQIWQSGAVRWLVLLQFSDLMLDVLYGYLALYMVDVMGLSAVMAGLAVGLWTGAGLLGDFLLIPLLERVRGLDYLRWSVLAELVLFPAFLLSTSIILKLVFVALLGFFNSGWYAILQGKLYSALPERSGMVLTLSNAAGVAGKLIPLAVGFAAETFGLGAAIWLLLLGPLALLVGMPKQQALTNG